MVQRPTDLPPGFPGYSTIRGHNSRSVRAVAGTFDDLYKHLTTVLHVLPVDRPEYEAGTEDEQKAWKAGPGLIFAMFTQPGVRDGEHLQFTTALGLDVDEQHVTLHTLLALLAGTSAIVYESLRSTPTARRWRVVIEFARPLTAEQHRLAFEYWSKRIPGVCRQVNDAVRLWYANQRFRGDPARIVERVNGEPWELVVERKASSREAFERHIKAPVDAPAAEGGRELALTAYARSIVERCDSYEAFEAALHEVNATYDPPLSDGEVRSKARRDWRKFRGNGHAQHAPAEREADPEFFLDIEAMARLTPEGPYWLVPGWLPGGTVTLYAGDGGSGKSYCSLDMAVCLAAGLSLFGQPVQRVRVMLVSAEDSGNVLHWRLTRICAKYGIELASLAGWLFIRDATCDSNVLYADSKLTGPAWTERLDVLGEQFQRSQAQVLILDNASDHYDANENERAKVRQFITGMNAVLTETQAVLLLAHVDALTAKAGEGGKGYSGSTAWNNSVRSRWYQWRDVETGALTLKLAKSNYARAGDTVEVAFDESLGCYTIGAAVKPLASLSGHAGLVLTLLDEVIAGGTIVSPAPQARNNAGAVLKGHGRLPKGAKPRQVLALVAELLAGEYLVSEEVRGRNGKASQRLALTDRGRAAKV